MLRLFVSMVNAGCSDEWMKTLVTVIGVNINNLRFGMRIFGKRAANVV